MRGAADEGVRLVNVVGVTLGRAVAVGIVWQRRVPLHRAHSAGNRRLRHAAAHGILVHHLTEWVKPTHHTLGGTKRALERR